MEEKENICNQKKVEHCEELAEIITNIVSNAESKRFEPGQKEIIFFAYSSDNAHAEKAKEDRAEGLWSKVTEYRPRLPSKGLKVPRSVNDPVIS